VYFCAQLRIFSAARKKPHENKRFARLYAASTEAVPVL